MQNKGQKIIIETVGSEIINPLKLLCCLYEAISIRLEIYSLIKLNYVVYLIVALLNIL